MYKNGIELKLLVNGRPMREYSHGGMTFYESRHGTNYTVRIRNDGHFRVMAVLSVDGLDVITGKPAEEVNKGYIIDGESSVEIKGYRISDANSASFIFAAKGKSYVTTTKGTSRNCGVIGVRVFREKEKPAPAPTVIHHHHHHPTYVTPYYVTPSYPWNPWTTGGYTITTQGMSNVVLDNATITGVSGTTGATGVCGSGGTTTTTGNSLTFAACASSNTSAAYTSQVSDGAPTNSGGNVLRGVSVSNAFDDPISYKSFDTGTAWGKKLDDKVKKEYFERGALLTELVTYYASKDALVKMGIDLQEEPRIAECPAPQAFGGKYCEPPKGWQG